ncbi:MAG: hypothetical protein RIS64_2526 [Bacteroidota bacterium]
MLSVLFRIFYRFRNRFQNRKRTLESTNITPFSQKYFTEKFAQLGLQDYVYENYSFADISEMKKVMENQMVVVKMSSEASNKGFEVTVDATTEGELTCLVKNTQNQTVMQRTQRLINGLNTVAIDMKGFSEGIYKLVLIRDKEEETLVLRKTREDMDSNSNVASDRKAKPAKN